MSATTAAQDDHLQVLFLGRMTKLKGGELLIRAAAQALSAGVRAVRIGDLDMFEHATAGTRLLATPPAVQPA